MFFIKYYYSVAFVPDAGFVRGGKIQTSDMVKLLTLPDSDQHNAHICSLVLSLPTVDFPENIQYNEYFKSTNSSPL